MRFTRAIILAGAAALAAAGTAQAASAEAHRTNVALPDGSIVQIEYVGEVAPRVAFAPPVMPRLFAFDLFAGFERIAAIMEAERRAMLIRIAAMQEAAAQAATAAPGETILVGNLPAGAHYTMVSSTTDANGCTRTVRYSSDGSGAAPHITRASAGTCDTARDAPAVVPVETVPSPAVTRGPGLEV